MNELKSVLKHLEDKEVKLSSEKVELASLDDIINRGKTTLKGLKNGVGLYDNIISNIKTSKKAMEDDYTKSFKVLEQAEKLEKDAKSLGLWGSVPSEFKSLVADISKEQDLLLTLINKLDKIA